MPVPRELMDAKTAHIFRYSSDLNTACTTLQDRIGRGTLLTIVNTQKDPAIFSGDPANSGRKVAWLVGHGSKAYTTIGTQTFGGTPLEIEFIMKWLSANGFTHVVDTCCEPNLRRLKEKHGLKYYCASDNTIVSVNQNHPTLDAWWDHNGFSQR